MDKSPPPQTIVVNKRRHKPGPNDVYIGRPSKWGNPFVIGRDGDRHEVVGKYARYLLFERPDLMKAMPELRGKTLVCWCKPELCHGDVLAELANAFTCIEAMEEK